MIHKVFYYIAKNPESENSFIMTGLLVCALSLIYAKCFPFPKPEKLGSTFGAAGVTAGILIGRFIEKKFVRFSVTGLNLKGIIISVIGLAVYYISWQNYKIIAKFFKPIITDSDLRRFVANFVIYIFVTVLWPIVIKRVCHSPSK